MRLRNEEGETGFHAAFTVGGGGGGGHGDLGPVVGASIRRLG